ncbi:hypothetical protein [Micromonospora sp. SH-82]|uniref:hypothetical protein n=1 Tax=Micromonospora sp. SH-82 TaxID=3132938 RepID=UPI003EB93DE6
MTDQSPPFPRRRLLAGAAATSALAAVGTTVLAPAAHAAPDTVPTGPGAIRSGPAPVVRDRIATARLVAADGDPAGLRLRADLHERLTAWLAFWSANSPPSWSAPVAVRGTTTLAGDAFTLLAVEVRRGETPVEAFTAARPDAVHRATEASLHHHFPTVRRSVGGGLRVVDGSPGFTGATEQTAFVAEVCRDLWGTAGRSADWQGEAGRVLARTGGPTDVTARSGWAAFTRSTLRIGLGTESYQ